MNWFHRGMKELHEYPLGSGKWDWAVVTLSVLVGFAIGFYLVMQLARLLLSN
jgi:hypothetical protein